MRQLSEHLFVVEDTCNAYLVRDGDAGLLIDAGGGAVSEVLSEAGVDDLEWILHTHHHRDQCWGTPSLVARHGARVAVPEHERYLFESAREHWQTKRIYDNYANGSTFFGPGADIPVDAVLEDYEAFTWRGLEFEVIPAQGHTFGSSALIAEIDGRRVAFTGDLLTAGGRVYQLHSLEYGYGQLAGVFFTLQSLQALRGQRLDSILPSHGPPIESVGRDLDRLEDRLMDLFHLEGGLPSGGPEAEGLPATRYLPEPRLITLSEHLLWSGPWAISNFYVILSGDGQALLVDYGQPLLANMHVGFDVQPYETMRFVVHHLDELRERFGVTAIEAVLVTHLHDDHTCGIPYLQRHRDTECWALDSVAKVIESPAEWASLPGLLSRPIEVHRKPADGETIEWRGFELSFRHAPGQTEFHSVISAEIDGRTVAFTGDNYFVKPAEIGGEVKLRPVQTTVFRNGFQLDMHRRCVEVMREVSPNLICPGHFDVLECSPSALDEYAAYVAAKERAFRALVDEPADHYLDLLWARLRPYLSQAMPGSRVEQTLMVRNNLERSATFAARLLAPLGWKASAELVEAALEPGGSAELALSIAVPGELAAGRTLLTAEVLVDGVSLGPLAEALVTVPPEGKRL